MMRSLTGRFAGVALAIAFATSAQAAPTFYNGDFSTFDASTSTKDKLTDTNSLDGLGRGWVTDSGYSFIINANQAVNGFYYSNVFNAEKLQLWSAGSSPTGNGGLGGTITAAPSPAGGNFLAADSMYQTGTYVLQQTVTGLTVGTTYNVSFWQAAGQQKNWYGDTTDTWAVKFGSTTKSAPTMSNPSGNFTSWTQVTLSFVADATSMVMQFLLSGTSPGGNQQPPFALLDGITVAQGSTPVPEPATAGLLLAGLAGLAGFGRRKARAR